MDNQDNTVWFAATTRNGQWKKIALTLSGLGVTFYIPKVYNTLLFLHTPKQRALSLVNSGEISARFLIDHSTHTLLEVPQKQMEDFMRVLDENPDAECVNDFSFAKGDRVIVTSGSLKGVEGEVVESPEGTFLVVNVSTLLAAKVRISRKNVAPAGKKRQ